MEVDKAIRIAITPEDIDERTEAHSVLAILDNGWDRVHLRHPGASRRDMINLIERIPQKYHSRLVLHGHFDLVFEFNLGGLHLNNRCPTPPPLFHGNISQSCHSIEEVKKCASLPSKYSYVTLSPIFDSISKKGYKSGFDINSLEKLSEISSLPVIALGGVTFERLPELSRYNFSGFAMLGSLPWGDADKMSIITKI
ncbi:MAG: thiamine phosphate synthase [Muribaculaceae bacterium]|nr:thiamine phosphate synthase [Muribaculaceae bacterium]